MSVVSWLAELANDSQPIPDTDFAFIDMLFHNAFEYRCFLFNVAA